MSMIHLWASMCPHLVPQMSFHALWILYMLIFLYIYIHRYVYIYIDVFIYTPIRFMMYMYTIELHSIFRHTLALRARVQNRNHVPGLEIQDPPPTKFGAQQRAQKAGCQWPKGGKHVRSSSTDHPVPPWVCLTMGYIPPNCCLNREHDDHRVGFRLPCFPRQTEP